MCTFVNNCKQYNIDVITKKHLKLIKKLRAQIDTVK